MTVNTLLSCITVVQEDILNSGVKKIIAHEVHTNILIYTQTPSTHPFCANIMAVNWMLTYKLCSKINNYLQ